MPIHTPGEKFRHSRIMKSKKGKRGVVAVLSLTAMVDMFTVLTIFLLQNYSATGQIIFIPKEVVLPKAEKTKELKPAVVVTISSKEVLIDKTPVIAFDALKAQSEWMIENLRVQMVEALKKAKLDYERDLQKNLQQAVEAAKGIQDEAINPWNKVTIQADKGIDFLTVKKVMYTVTESGAGEINFAVTKTGSEE